MDALCAFAGAVAITIAALPAFVPAPPMLAIAELPPGQSFVDQPPVPPPRA